MRKKILPYNPKLVPIARSLRNNMTFTEILLWKKLKNKQMLGFDFDRQKPIGEYIVDFFCSELQLAIEVDGYSHLVDTIMEKDKERQESLEKLGVRFLRFSNQQILKDMMNVLRHIEIWIEENKERSSINK
jgi:very-short-patch-repair endonuclease